MMMRTTGKQALSVSRMLLPLVLVVGLDLSRADAQDINAASSTAALAQVTQLGNDVRAMRAAAATPLGPYELATECTWCSKDFIGICLEHTTETWRTNVDFTWTRDQLNHVLAQLQQSTDAFPQAYGSIQSWIDTIPAFVTRFDHLAGIVLDVQQQIKNGIGPNDQQRQTVTEALQTLITDLTANTAQLEDGTKRVAAALQQQSAFGPAINQAIAGADESAKSSLANLQQVASTHRCQDGLSDKFNAIRSGFSSSIGTISTAFQKVEASRQAADRGLAYLLGTLVSSRTDMQSVMDGIRATKSDALGSFLFKLHLESAKTQLQQISDYLTSHLSHNSG